MNATNPDNNDRASPAAMAISAILNIAANLQKDDVNTMQCETLRFKMRFIRAIVLDVAEELKNNPGAKELKR